MGELFCNEICERHPDCYSIYNVRVNNGISFVCFCCIVTTTATIYDVMSLAMIVLTCSHSFTCYVLENSLNTRISHAQRNFVNIRENLGLHSP